MRRTPPTLRFLTLSLSLLAASLAWGQTPAASTDTGNPATAPKTAQVKPAIEQRTERIHVEDAATIIDEVRIGGATKSIDVRPKGGMPAYQVAPADGQRSWKVLGF